MRECWRGDARQPCSGRSAAQGLCGTSARKRPESWLDRANGASQTMLGPHRGTCSSLAKSPPAAADFEAAIMARSSAESLTAARHSSRPTPTRHGRCYPARPATGCARLRARHREAMSSSGRTAAWLQNKPQRRIRSDGELTADARIHAKGALARINISASPLKFCCKSSRISQEKR